MESHCGRRSIREKIVRLCGDTNLKNGKGPLTTYAIRGGELFAD